MGRSGWRPVVEDGFTLDIWRLQRRKMLGQGSWSLAWTNTATGEKVGSIGYTVDLERYYINLIYTTTIDGEKHDVNDPVGLETTDTNFGGMLFWFQCPRCGRRCAKLYLPPGAVHFRCRVCYNLTYQSCNESHKFDGLYAMLAAQVGCSIGAVKRALRNDGRS